MFYIIIIIILIEGYKNNKTAIIVYNNNNNITYRHDIIIMRKSYSRCFVWTRAPHVANYSFRFQSDLRGFFVLARALESKYQFSNHDNRITPTHGRVRQSTPINNDVP